MDLKMLHRRAGDQATVFIAGVKEDQWELVSNCPKWTVRQLVNHITGENWWMPEILAGKTIEEVGRKFEGDLLGTDPLKAWNRSFEASQRAIGELQSLETIVHLSYGDAPVSRYLEEHALDRLIHGWDIAISTGQKDELDAEIVQEIYDRWLPRRDELDELRGTIFAEEVPVQENADTQTKLLALFGRRRPLFSNSNNGNLL